MSSENREECGCHSAIDNGQIKTVIVKDPRNITRKVTKDIQRCYVSRKIACNHLHAIRKSENQELRRDDVCLSCFLCNQTNRFLDSIE